MLLIPCPYCGERPEIEFQYGGEAHIGRPSDPMRSSDESWERYLFIRSNTKGLHLERWRHLHGCGRFFNVARDTATDRIELGYENGRAYPGPPGPTPADPLIERVGAADDRCT